MRPKKEQPDPEPATTTATLRSREFVNKLIRERDDNTTRAKSAYEHGQAAFAEAVRLDSIVERLTGEEQQTLARLQQLQAERDNTQHAADKARTDGGTHMSAHANFLEQAADAQTVLDTFDVPVDSDSTTVLAVSNGSGDPAGPTSVDLAEDQRLDDGVRRLIHAHDTDPAGESGAA